MKDSRLIPGPSLVLYPALAQEIGLKEALVLQQLHYWLGTDSGKVIKGRRWIYNSVSEWQKQLPFFSKDTVKRTLNSLREKKLIERNNYNQKPGDKTWWYTINYDNEVITRLRKSAKKQEETYRKKRDARSSNVGAEHSYGRGQSASGVGADCTKHYQEITHKTKHENNQKESSSKAAAELRLPSSFRSMIKTTARYIVRGDAAMEQNKITVSELNQQLQDIIPDGIDFDLDKDIIKAALDSLKDSLSCLDAGKIKKSLRSYIAGAVKKQKNKVEKEINKRNWERGIVATLWSRFESIHEHKPVQNFNDAWERYAEVYAAELEDPETVGHVECYLNKWLRHKGIDDVTATTVSPAQNYGLEDLELNMAEMHKLTS